MRKHIISYILSAACALSACSTDYFEPDSPTQFPGDDEILSLTVSASQSVIHDGVSSRAINVDTVAYTVFEKGDSIGVIVKDANGTVLVNNAPFRYDGSNWVFDADKDGEEKRPYYDAAMKSYIVYFPYTPTADGCTDVDGIKSLERFRHKDNQNSKEDYLNSDIMVCTFEVKEGEKAPKRIEAKMTHVYDTFSLVQPKVKWDIVPTGEKLEYTTKDETISDLIIEYEPENGDKIILKDNTTDLTYRGTDRSYRYLLPEKQEGTITWQYTYRGITFHGERKIETPPSGKRISSSDTGYMGSLPGPKMEFSDFYCSKDTLGQRLGYVIPWDAEECLKGRHCIGLVAGVGQNQDDFSDYSGSGIGKRICQGYVISLTDTFSEPFLVTYGDMKVLPWASDSVNNEKFTITLYYKTNDWSGYYNHQKILEQSNKTKNGLLDFPAAYTCEYYGKYTVTTENDEPKQEWVPEGSHTGLEAPDNTSGWFLPTVHMLYALSAVLNNFTIGGTLYSHTKIKYYDEEAGVEREKIEVYAIDKLFNDRLEIIKKYAVDRENPDPIYQSGICNYLELPHSPTKFSHWGSNQCTTESDVWCLSTIGSLETSPKNGNGRTAYELRARAFLAF